MIRKTLITLMILGTVIVTHAFHNATRLYELDLNFTSNNYSRYDEFKANINDNKSLWDSLNINDIYMGRNLKVGMPLGTLSVIDKFKAHVLSNQTNIQDGIQIRYDESPKEVLFYKKDNKNSKTQDISLKEIFEKYTVNNELDNLKKELNTAKRKALKDPSFDSTVQMLESKMEQSRNLSNSRNILNILKTGAQKDIQIYYDKSGTLLFFKTPDNPEKVNEFKIKVVVLEMSEDFFKHIKQYANIR